MSDEKKYVIGAVLVVVLVALLFVPFTQDFRTYDAEVEFVSGADGVDLGVSIDADRIDFGRVPEEARSVEKALQVSNSGDDRLKLSMDVSGNISEFVFFSPESVEVAPGQEANITVGVSRTGADDGYYSGTIRVRRTASLWDRIV